MKKLIHVNTPEELREGDVFCGWTFSLENRGLPRSEATWTKDGYESQYPHAAFLFQPNGFEVEREVPVEPVVWEGVVSRYDDLLAQELYQKLFVIGLGHKHRVTVEEIEEIKEIEK